jgi:hypothetical protein
MYKTQQLYTMSVQFQWGRYISRMIFKMLHAHSVDSLTRQQHVSNAEAALPWIASMPSEYLLMTLNRNQGGVGQASAEGLHALSTHASPSLLQKGPGPRQFTDP